MTPDAPLPPSPLELGLQAMREGRSGDALHAFEQAYHLNPNDHRLHQATGELYLNQGDLRRAREYLRYAIHLAPEEPEPRYLMARLALQEGRSQEGMQLLRSVLLLNPTHEAARRALTAEEDRARAAERLPLWQPRRAFTEPILLAPPRQIGPDGRDRPAALRAPHHCLNCFLRPGQKPEKMHAYRYRWWNLGLVGMLFGGWPVYLLWTYAVREKRFSFEPLYCPVCSSHRRVLTAALWVLVGLGALLLTVVLLPLVSVAVQAPSDALTIASLIVGAAAVLCCVFAAWAGTQLVAQRGVHLHAVGDDQVSFAFVSPDYLRAFRALNEAFVVNSGLRTSDLGPRTTAPTATGGAP